MEGRLCQLCPHATGIADGFVAVLSSSRRHVEALCAFPAPTPTRPDRPPTRCAANGRTVRSLAYMLSMYKGVKIYFVAPDVVSTGRLRAAASVGPPGSLLSPIGGGRRCTLWRL